MVQSGIARNNVGCSWLFFYGAAARQTSEEAANLEVAKPVPLDFSRQKPSSRI
jgi:hypothetical protein